MSTSACVSAVYMCCHGTAVARALRFGVPLTAASTGAGSVAKTGAGRAPWIVRRSSCLIMCRTSCTDVAGSCVKTCSGSRWQ